MKVFLLKAWLGGAGLVVGIVGMALELRWLVWSAAAFLAAAFLLRFVKPRQGAADAQP